MSIDQMFSYEDLQQKQYLYVRVFEAKDFSGNGHDPYVEVRLGNYKETTRFSSSSSSSKKKKSNHELNQVFVFSRDRIQTTMLEITVKDNFIFVNDKKDDFIGWILYDLCDVPKRVPQDTPVDSQWYRLKDRKGDTVLGEVMLAVWLGTEADEAFSDAASVGGVAAESAFATSIRSRVYLSPKLWYVRVNVIEGQDLIPNDTTQSRSPEIFVKGTLGNQTMSTGISSVGPLWNEEFMFVAAEPFEEHLILSVEDRIGPKKNEVVGTCIIPLQYVDRRFDDRAIRSRWFNLQRDVIVEGEKTKQPRFTSRIRMMICLEGGYHVESANDNSDLRPTTKQLWKKSVGILELGILGAQGLSPMKVKDGRETTDAYCVVMYGTKWVRTRTIIDSFTPKWNEQYTWEVFDPCTVITLGVFDNCHLQGATGGIKDSRIGKVKIRVSTLETDRVYTHSYPLLVLHPSGVKKMGEIRLAFRFSCTSLLNLIHMYSQPLFPKMNYIHPLPVTQLHTLRYHAGQIICTRLARAEPSLTKDVVECMLDVGSDMWSTRRSKANFLRIMDVFGGLFAAGKWFEKPIDSFVILVVILAVYPSFILPSFFFWLFLMGVWNYRQRPRFPPHMDTRLSCADNIHPDELDEEFDTFPTSHPADIISVRYDRLRSESRRIQTVVGDIATQGERLQSLLSWRDPIATTLFVIFCLISAIVLYATPFYVVVIQTFVYVLNRLRVKNKLPSVPINFFTRLPAKTDCMI